MQQNTHLDQIIGIINSLKLLNETEKDKWIKISVTIYETKNANDFKKLFKIFADYKQKQDLLDQKQQKLQKEYVAKANDFITKSQSVKLKYIKKSEEILRNNESKELDSINERLKDL